MRRLPEVFFLLILLLLPASPAAVAAESGQDIGKVIALNPGASVLRDGLTEALDLHAGLRLSDTVSTDASGRVKILFNDDSAVSIGPNTVMEMSEYADSGSKSGFGLRVPQGVIRAITGKIVDQNPDGFKIATPEASVGIRGTIVSLRTGGGVTTVYVENTLRQVYVNGINVPSGSKITIPSDPLRLEPIRPQDRRDLGRDLALLGGSGVAAAAPEPGGGKPSAFLASGPGLLPPDTPLADIGQEKQRLGDNLLATGNNTGIARVSGDLFTAPASDLLTGTGATSLAYGVFGFDVDLGSGAITDAFMKGGTDANPMNTLSNHFAVQGGSGQFNGVGSSTVITGFAGELWSGGVGGSGTLFTIAPSNNTRMNLNVGSDVYSTATGSVNGSYYIGTAPGAPSGWANADFGTFSGQREP
ncbi:MAG: FecR family protein [Desulfovibrionaceae bacterium]|nr:FecR family protein [Desulfovibrionaceae bacterium]